MSDILNQELINACIDEINSWPDWPEASPATDSDYIDVSYQHILFTFTLKNIYDMGADKSDLVRRIIMELDYWPSTTPYQDFDGWDSTQQRPLIMAKKIAGTTYTNNPIGWEELAAAIACRGLKATVARDICLWNDPNGDWNDRTSRGAYVHNHLACVMQILEWANT